jgi:PAS domain S-box-containing protein
MPLVIIRLEDSSVRFVNEPFQRLFGLRSGEAETLAPATFYADPTSRERFIAQMRERGAVDGLEQVFRRADGTTFPGAVTSRLIDYEGAPAFVSAVIDLTERKAAEAEIQRQREALHQGEKLTALGALLAGVAHELNNPLSVVVGYSGMLRELAQDEATRERAERVHAAAERCAKIVKTFLAMARSRPPQRGQVAINQVVEAALDLATYGLRTADVAVTRDLAAGLPPVWGDGDQLHQVLTNLIVNAQQALLQRPAPRRLQLRSRCEGDVVTVEIEDNGPGMTEEVKKRIFEPFFSTKPHGTGTGIGLSVCHGIVTAHGGRILVRSQPGEGTLFLLELPAHGGAKATTPHATKAAPLPMRGRVLVVDDEPEIAELVAEHLRRDGLVVEVAASGRAALELLGHERFDLIVLVMRMRVIYCQ